MTSGDVLVRALYSGISRGTEALVFEGGVPESEYQRMRAPFQAGSFPAPVKYGYASVGGVERGPRGARGPPRVRAPSAPDAVRRAGERRPRAAARRAAGARRARGEHRDGDQRPLGRARQVGDRMTVIGAGTVGCLVAWLAAAMPAARSSWWTSTRSVRPSRARSACASRRPTTARENADVVIHASGSAAGLERGAARRRFRGDDRRDELVRRAGRPAAARRGLSRATADAQVVAGRARRRVAACALGSRRAAWRSPCRSLADPALDALITGESDVRRAAAR